MRTIDSGQYRLGAKGPYRSCPPTTSRKRVGNRHREVLMSIFDKIKNAIFGTKAAANSASATKSAAAPASSGASPASAPAQAIDIAPILDSAVAAKKEKLQWRTSI